VAYLFLVRRMRALRVIVVLALCIA